MKPSKKLAWFGQIIKGLWTGKFSLPLILRSQNVLKSKLKRLRMIKEKALSNTPGWRLILSKISGTGVSWIIRLQVGWCWRTCISFFPGSESWFILAINSFTVKISEKSLSEMLILNFFSKAIANSTRLRESIPKSNSKWSSMPAFIFNSRDKNSIISFSACGWVKAGSSIPGAALPGASCFPGFILYLFSFPKRVLGSSSLVTVKPIIRL